MLAPFVEEPRLNRCERLRRLRLGLQSMSAVVAVNDSETSVNIKGMTSQPYKKSNG